MVAVKEKITTIQVNEAKFHSGTGKLKYNTNNYFFSWETITLSGTLMESCRNPKNLRSSATLESWV
jgi:hypothetical protein